MRTSAAAYLILVGQNWLIVTYKADLSFEEVQVRCNAMFTSS